MACILEAKGISKSFPGVKANDDVDFCVDEGTIHAVLGENGAGKSTLMRIIYGLYQKDSGEIFLRGQQVDIPNPMAAIRHGIGMVHQEFQLVPSLTVAENVALGHEKLQGPFVNTHHIEQTCREIAERLGIDIDPTRPVSELSIGYQQRVEIIKLLYREADILILDEPTTVLTPQEVEGLFQILYQLRDEGHTIVLITHKLNEVKECAGKATVLRKGRLQGTVKVADTSEEEIVQMMMGQKVENARRTGGRMPGGEVLRLDSLHTKDLRGVYRLKGLSFSMREGEIVGLAGVEGNGQAEIVESIAGIRHHSGSVVLQGSYISKLSPRRRRLAGLAVIPENRGLQGLNTMGSVAENLVSTTYFTSDFSRWSVLNNEKVRRFATESIERYNIAAEGPEAAVSTLSGGNAQKLVVARELTHDPAVLLAAHPTRGLDIRAAQFVRSQLLRLRENGVGVLLISADLEELFALSDRILVIFDGRIVGECDPASTSYEELGLLMSGAREQNGTTDGSSNDGSKEDTSNNGADL